MINMIELRVDPIFQFKVQKIDYESDFLIQTKDRFSQLNYNQKKTIKKRNNENCLLLTWLELFPTLANNRISNSIIIILGVRKNS